jgi:hypothetical protein
VEARTHLTQGIDIGFARPSVLIVTGPVAMAVTLRPTRMVVLPLPAQTSTREGAIELLVDAVEDDLIDAVWLGAVVVTVVIPAGRTSPQ